MKRLLFNFLAAVSLLLFLALCAAWVRSFWSADQVHLWYGPVNVARYPARADSEGIGIHHFSGSVVIQRVPRMHRWAGRNVQWDYRALPPEVLADAFAPLWSIGQAWSFLGFGYASRSEENLLIPHYGIALATALAPAWWVAKRVRRRRTRTLSLCSSCGYDLRATPGRCPECGAMPEQAKAVLT